MKYFNHYKRPVDLQFFQMKKLFYKSNCCLIIIILKKVCHKIKKLLSIFSLDFFLFFKVNIDDFKGTDKFIMHLTYFNISLFKE